VSVILGSLGFIIAGWIFTRWAIKKKKKDIAKRKAAKVVKFDITESYYDN